MRPYTTQILLPVKNQGYSDEEINLFRNGTKPDLYPNTNWVDLLFDDWTVTTKHSLNFSGGTKNYVISQD